MGDRINKFNTPQYRTDEIPGILQKSGIEMGDGQTSRFANEVVKKYGRLNKPLPFDLAYAAGIFAIFPYYQSLYNDASLKIAFGSSEKSQERVCIQSVVLLSSIYSKETNNKEGADAQLAGISAAIFDYDIQNARDGSGFLNPETLNICDNCGTGGDTLNTFHISSSAALIAAAAGAVIAKHGSPGNARRSGSSDFVKSLGMPVGDDISPKNLEKLIDIAHFGYIEAADPRYKAIHLQTQVIVGMSHMNDIIGPITNPINPDKLTVKVLGTNQVISPQVVAGAYKILNERGITKLNFGLFVKGLSDERKPDDTMDEISILPGGTDAVFMANGKTENIRITYANFGFKHPAKIENISPSSTKSDDRIGYSLDVMNGKGTEDATNLVLANAAALIALNRGRTDLSDLRAEVDEAREILENKKWAKVVENVRETAEMLRRE